VSGTGFELGDIPTPFALGPNQSTSFTVTFAPQSSGSTTGTVTITSDASNPSLTIPLSGTGLAPGALGPSPTSLSFGSVTVGSNQSLSETLTNTGGTSVTISQVGISGTGFTLSGITTPVTLPAGQSASFNVTFTPTTAAAATGSVTVSSNASNPTLTIGLTGTGIAPGALGASPTSLSFGNVTVGSNQSLSETVTNTGGTSVTISQVGISGTGFTLSGITTPVTLTAGQSASFSVTFTPTTAAAASGTVTVSSNASNPTLTIPLSGTGVAAVGQLAVSPSTLSVGSVVVGTSGSASASLAASGASVTVSAVSSNNAAFSVGGISLPVTIPAGQSASFSVTFTPPTTGAANATLTFSSNAQPSMTTETVTGTGEAAPTYSVSLSWNASTSPNISGYNIYRAVYTSSCGSFSMINPTLSTSTSYTDSEVTDGTTYCYTTTAVNSSNQESSYSNIVSNIQIPAP
jgi:Abnormal spindle-like microcephaly-assoc'd, ASPM-SPD-2-Hydin